jgi:hypothetical protein
MLIFDHQFCGHSNINVHRRSQALHNVQVSIEDEARCPVLGPPRPLRGSRGRFAVLIYFWCSRLIAGLTCYHRESSPLLGVYTRR